MQDKKNNWIDFWDRNDVWWSLKLWKTNVDLFLREVKKIIPFNQNEVVLNIGCGQGYFEELLAPYVKSIVALDTSEQSVEMCRHTCRMQPNVSVQLLGQDYTNLTGIGNGFSLILCISVVQYYKDIGEIETLIRSVQEIAAPGAKLLIADIPLKRNNLMFIWDALCSLVMGLRLGYIGQLFEAACAVYVKNPDYRRFNQPQNILCLSDDEINDLIKRMKLDATVIKRNLSVYANRPSLLVHF